MSFRILCRSFNGVSCKLLNDNVRNRISVRFSSFKAAILNKKSDDSEPFKITEVKATKKLKKGQVRIKVKSCTFNVWDYAIAQNHSKSDNQTLGYEVCGEVLEAGDSEDFGKGDKVIAMSKTTMGGFAEQIVVDEKDVWLKPANVGLAEACTLLESYGSAILGLVKGNHITEKQDIVITLASGHGYAPLDIAANVYKAKVIAVCEHEGEESAGLRERGAWTALAYAEKPLQAALKGKGLTLAYSTMSGPVLFTILSCLSYGGRVVYTGSEDLPSISAAYLLNNPSFSISPVSLWSARNYSYNIYREAISDVLDMCDQNLISPYVSAKFKLEDINKAYKYFKEKRPIGKIVVTMDD